MWKSTNIFLRPVTLIDLQTLLEWENNPDNWEISGTTAPFSEEEMIDFIIEQADYKATRQLRLMICMNEQLIPVGAIDLFEIDEDQRTAGVGILIHDPQHRKKGYATEALELVKQMARSELNLSTLYCSIQPHNDSSLRLFKRCGFLITSTGEELVHYRVDLSNEA